MRARVLSLAHARWLLIVLAVAVAATLRLHGITRVGICFDDEGAYVTDARLWHRCMRVLTDPSALRAIAHGDKTAFQQRMDAIGVDFTTRYVKPCLGYTFLGAAAMFVVGEQPAALLVTNAICGTLAVLVLYAMGAALSSRTVALVGAWLLAVSPYHIVYCRSALPEATAGLFALLGILAWAYGHTERWSLPRSRLLTGAALGWAICGHYRAAFLLPALAVADVLLAARATAPRKPVRALGRHLLAGWLYLGLGVALPIGLLEAMFRSLHLVAWITDSYLPLPTYLQALAQFGAVLADDLAGGATSHNLDVVRAYIGYFAHWHGTPAVLLAAIGILWMLRSPGVAQAPAVILVTALVVLLLQRAVVARGMSFAVPMFCLCVAGAAHWLSSVARSSRVARVAIALLLTVVIGGPATRNAWSLTGKRSQLSDACALLAGRAAAGDRVALPADTRKYRVHLDCSPVTVVELDHYRRTIAPDDLLSALRRDGVRWVICDPQYWHYRDDRWPAKNAVFRWGQAADALLRTRAPLVAEFPHVTDYRWEFLAEGPGLAHLGDMTQDAAGCLRVYDLGPLPEPTDGVECQIVRSGQGPSPDPSPEG